MTATTHEPGHDPNCRSAYCDPRYFARPWNASIYRLLEAAKKHAATDDDVADAVEALQQQIWNVLPEQWGQGRHRVTMEWENLPDGTVRLLRMDSGGPASVSIPAESGAESS